MKLIWMAAGLALAATSTAYAKDEDNADAKEEKVICKSEPVLGSRTRVKRTCLTQAQWDEVAEAARDGVDDIARDAAQAPRNGPN